ncbi:MAG: sensor histidine kinase [Candidatus Eutrophobiaceae bacterium]
MSIELKSKGSLLPPDFCSVRSVFITILLTELLAIALTVGLAAEPEQATKGFWYSLAFKSLFLQWLALGDAAALCLYFRRFGTRLRMPTLLSGAFALFMLTSTVITALFWELALRPAGEPLGSERYWHFMVHTLIVIALFGGFLIRYLYVLGQWKRNAELSGQLRFQALQARIRPHFLFNCLNTIAALTEEQPKIAERMVEDLATMMRVALDESQTLLPARKEIELCELYLRMEKLRLEERLQVEWDLDKLPENANLPRLTLQPLLENAIYHGIERLPNGGIIQISCRHAGRGFEIAVRNPKPVDAETDSPGFHLAIENVRQRLQAFHNETDCLICNDEHRGFYEVRLKLPMDDSGRA